MKELDEVKTQNGSSEENGKKIIEEIKAEKEGLKELVEKKEEKEKNLKKL